MVKATPYRFEQTSTGPMKFPHFTTSFACLLVLVASVSTAPAADPTFYVRGETWQDSMLLSLEAIDAAKMEETFTPFESDTFRGGDEPRQITLELGGAQEIYLAVTGCPDIKWGVGDWAEAELIEPGGNRVRLSKVKEIKALVGRHELDMTLRAGLYEKMRMGGRQYEHGINAQANSIIRVPLERRFEKFQAWIGVDSWARTNGFVRFSVLSQRAAARKQLWEYLIRDFPESAPREQIRWEREDRIFEQDWKPGDFGTLAKRYAQASSRVPALARETAQLSASCRSKHDLHKVRDQYYRSRQLDLALSKARLFDFSALRLAIEDLHQTYPDQYRRGPQFLERVGPLQENLRKVLTTFSGSLQEFETIDRLVDDLNSLRKEALLANPLLDFERLLVIKRKPIGEPRRSQWEDRGLGEYIGVPKQSSWGNATMTGVHSWDNEVAVLSPPQPDGKLTTLFKPEGRRLLTDIDLHWNADKMLFAMPDEHKRWQIYEIRSDGTGLRQLTPGNQPDVHNYDPCYLPDGRFLFISTAAMQGVPCNPGVIVGMMYQADANGQNIRQLCFEQDHDYNPSVMNDGRVVYLRWDYTDTPHVWNRLLMTMNPDGTTQSEFYGANSYWPNAIFFPRAIPNQAERFVGIVTGHHEGRVGELILFDPSKGRHETSGVIQRIPGRGQKVQPLIEDKLTEHSWPKLLHPWPLSDKYLIVAAKPEPDSLWGIYLVDVFDNMVLLKEEEHHVLLEPIVLAPRSLPPVIPDKTRPDAHDALVYMEDVYAGPGLKDVSRGAVKKLRLFTYHFGYQTLAGIDHRVGTDGPWEVKRVLGTVPVEEDGSALFRIPAKTPISVQPLDQEGKAIALMRSWTTAMPGENMSCVGCHEQKNSAPLSRKTAALSRSPSEIEPWRGPVRGFSFSQEVQPVLDKFCVGCHDGRSRGDQPAIPDLRADQGAYVVYERGKIDGEVVRGKTREELQGKFGGVFDPAYIALRQYIRVGGLESDLHILPPREFHADSSELIQMLRKGHHNVQLDAEAWDRLITWIDLNAPAHGTWADVTRIPDNQRERRIALRELYGGLVEDCETPVTVQHTSVEAVLPEPLPPASDPQPSVAGWPFNEEDAQARQNIGGPATREIDLGGNVNIRFRRIPAGSFIMGNNNGEQDERPVSAVRIADDFWMAECEITNEQFARFKPSHDSRFEHRSSWIFSEEYLGWPLNTPKQPVVRISWNEAIAFCDWLSEQTGERVTLPTEAQWEYACRAGRDTPFSYGDLETDFSRHANMADLNLRKLADEGWRPKAPDLVPRDDRFNDGSLVTTQVGRYLPNAWGLFDMHGNVSEWTRSGYLPYPYKVQGEAALKTVRGGSWRDRPRRCQSSFRLPYAADQKVFNVGFRVVIEPGGKVIASAP